MPDSKNIPAPVCMAQAVLDGLEEKQRAGFTKILPAFAMQLARAGQTVNEEILREHLARGTAHMESEAARLRQGARTATAPARSYDDIVGKFSPVKMPTPATLLEAAEVGDVALVQYLHEHGADIRAQSNGALRGAAQSGHLAVVKYLHAHGGADIRARNDVALRGAAQDGHLEVVKYLHEHGADIRANKDEALHLAAANGHLEVVKYLHAHGADIRAQGDRASHWAVEKGHFNIIDFLQRRGALVVFLSEGGWEELRLFREGTARWEKLHGADSCPDGLEGESPYLFRRDAFEAVQPMLKKEGYSGATANRYAFAVAALLGTEGRVLNYLEKWSTPGKQPLHDIVYDIALPQEGRFDVAAWGDAVLKNGPKMAKLVKFAHKMPQPEKDGSGGWSYRRTKEKIAQFAFKNGAKNPPLAALCLDHAWDDEDFDDALKAVNAYQKKYAANDNKKPDNIPALDIDGKKFNKPDYHLYKLPDGDLRGLFLGEFTNCCQHLAGEGSECAEHGYLSKNGGFYVVAHKQTDEIGGQAWAWRGTKGELVLDSLESLSGHFNAASWGAALKEMAAVVKTRPDIEAFNVGAGGATPDDLPFAKTDTSAKPRGYRGYRDSHRQFKIT